VHTDQHPHTDVHKYRNTDPDQDRHAHAHQQANGTTPTATPTPACSAGDTGWLDASAQAADSGGDGNGFERNPSNAFADGVGYAENENGDRHRYYDYGITVSPACAIRGIEVRLDWWLDSTFGTNSMSGSRDFYRDWVPVRVHYGP